MKKITIITLLILSLISTAFSNNNVCENTYQDIVPIVKQMGFFVTATNKGRHNTGSKHYNGKAVDVRTRDKTDAQIMLLKYTLESMGYVFRDERVRPKGQRVWSGPHVHIHIPECPTRKNIFILEDVVDFEPNMCIANFDRFND